MAGRRRKTRWKELPANSSSEKTQQVRMTPGKNTRVKVPRFKQADLIKEENGVKWFAVTCLAEWPCTPSGGMRAAAENGIYLDMIGMK